MKETKPKDPKLFRQYNNYVIKDVKCCYCCQSKNNNISRYFCDLDRQEVWNPLGYCNMFMKEEDVRN